MLYLAFKAALSGVIIAIVSEVAQRRPGLGALIVSLPLVSILAIIWLWRDTGDVARIAAHAEGRSGSSCPPCRCFWSSLHCCAQGSDSGSRLARRVC
jgi:hypothetical protein